MFEENAMRKMKDSGIVWIGEIPEGWSIARLSQISEIITGGTPPKNNSKSYYSVNGVMWVKPNDLNGLKEINCTKEYLTEEGCQFVKLVAPNTPLICCIGSIGKLGVSNYGVTFNQQINAILFNERVINIRFGFYSLFVQEQQHEYYSNGNVVKIINSSNHGQVVIAYPNKILQQKIADFLDKKCAEIDKLIELQESMIEKLKEYKQSVITQAVTKGLDPDVPMKDSGFEWIGKIPEGWEIVLLSSIFKQHKEKNINNKENNLLSLSYGKIIRKDISLSDGLLPQSFETYNIINNGDIVFRLTDLQNDKRSLRTGLCKEKGIITSAYVTIRPAVELSSKYMQYLYHTYDICKVFYGMGDGVRQGMNYDDLRRLPTLFPKYTEQMQIADFLDKKCAEIDNLIELKEQKIEKLKEYKKSLIYEYVTGKKEVV